MHSFGRFRIERFGEVCFPVQIRAGRAQFPVPLGGAFQVPGDVAGFEDEDFSAASYTALGPFAKFRMKFDQQSVRDMVDWFSRK